MGSSIGYIFVPFWNTSAYDPVYKFSYSISSHTRKKQSRVTKQLFYSFLFYLTSKTFCIFYALRRLPPFKVLELGEGKPPGKLNSYLDRLIPYICVVRRSRNQLLLPSIHLQIICIRDKHHTKASASLLVHYF